MNCFHLILLISILTGSQCVLGDVSGAGNVEQNRLNPSNSDHPRFLPPPYMRGFYGHLFEPSFLKHSPQTAIKDVPVSDKETVQADITSHIGAPEIDILTPYSMTTDMDNITMLREREQGCRKYCVEHGSCDEETKSCICDTYWTANPFKFKSIPYQPNCDWNIFLIVAALIGIAFGLIVIAMVLHACLKACCGCCKSTKTRRYKMLDDDEDLGIGKGLRTPRGKPKKPRLADSDDEAHDTLFEARNPKFYGGGNHGGESSKANP